MIVTTPQDIALLDARRGAEMFKQVNVPVCKKSNYLIIILFIGVALLYIGIGCCWKYE